MRRRRRVGKEDEDVERGEREEFEDEAREEEEEVKWEEEERDEELRGRRRKSGRRMKRRRTRRRRRRWRRRRWRRKRRRRRNAFITLGRGTTHGLPSGLRERFQLMAVYNRLWELGQMRPSSYEDGQGGNGDGEVRTEDKRREEVRRSQG
ncbi:unnamed protein product [Nesidiocoris tenuis]|uniref:Uncharacterized protein n=1 Tax=Nesidiocoris tenuis TaxID=355587 RepID=A0A6H5H9Z3_9HEMI|nr:unnamed protein product [Nesidiocoris tenuis]